MVVGDKSGGAAETLDSIVSHWVAGNVDFLAIGDPGDAADALARQKQIIFDRNANWLPVIEGLLLDNHEDLIVVGAAHLAGSDSVLDLLATAGYTVTRVQ